MTYVRTVAPASAITLAAAKAQCRVDGGDQDALIATFIDAATAHFDGRFGVLGRALMTQTWQYLGPVPMDHVRLELPPIQSVSTIECLIDGAYVTQTLGDYAVREIGQRTIVRPATGKAWPVMDTDEHAVRITFVTGQAVCPGPIQSAILLTVGNLYRNREGVAANSLAALPMGVDALIAPYRMVGV